MHVERRGEVIAGGLLQSSGDSSCDRGLRGRFLVIKVSRVSLMMGVDDAVKALGTDSWVLTPGEPDPI